MGIIDHHYAILAASAMVVATTGLIVLRRMKRATQRDPCKPVISHIIIYPVKGCRGVDRYSVEIGSRGMEHDREYAVISKDADSGEYKALSQSKYPKLSCIVPVSFDSTSITLSSPDGGKLIHRSTEAGKEYSIDFFGDRVKVIDQGDDASRWFSKYLATDVRFVKLNPNAERTTSGGERKPNSFFYRTPTLVLSTESLADLSQRVGFAVGHDRFRPNIVISGLEKAWAEDDISRFNIGNLSLTGYEHCERCSIPAVDQATGVLSTSFLAACRRVRSGATMKYKRYPVKDDQWYVGTYFEPSVPARGKTRIYIGQEVKLA
jgi:uncharacterized protein YcbX